MDETVENQEEATVQDGAVAVDISEDLMSAFIAVTPPDNGGREVTTQDALSALMDAGVFFGIDEGAVGEAVAAAASGQGLGPARKSTLVARGQTPVPGEDARIEYDEILTAPGGRPRVLPDGSVDLLDLNLVHNVAKATVLATRIPPTQGEAGTNVLGNPIPARPGRDCRPKVGRGAAITEDGLRVEATVQGHATLVDEKISVTPSYEVAGDVSIETGNIQFLGSVVVRGSVRPALKVKAEGDIQIWGGVDRGSLEAGGNVTVQGGIQGGSRGSVVAGGAVRAKFVENADVRAGSNLWAADGIVHSRVEAGGNVEVLGRHGAIIGGRITAKSNVSARVLGSTMNARTEIAVGTDPGVREAILDGRKAQAALEEKLERARAAAQFYEHQDRSGRLPAWKLPTLRQLVQIRDQLAAELEELKSHLLELEQKIVDPRKARVEAKEVCYPGVRIVIGNAQHLVTDVTRRSRFHLNEAQEIVASSL